MAVKESMTAMDKRWREESDVRTLTEAEKIKSDRTRLGPAQKRAKIMVAEAMKEANAVKKVAGAAPIKKVAAKKGGTKKKKK